MSATKRKSSRSPEGSNHQRKALRNDSISASNESRKNSYANANMVDASADPRQNRGAAAIVRSPVSTDGSTYQDAASSRSTPRPSNLKDSSIVATTHEEGDADEADDAAMNPLLGPLSALLGLVRAESAAQASHKLVRIQLEIATSEHQHMKNNFQRFPSIEERVKKGKSTAEQEIAKIERQLKVNTDLQPGLAKSLAAAFLNISSRAEQVRVPQVSSDAVTREEFKELQESFTKQQDTLDEQKGLIAKQQEVIGNLQSLHAESKNTALQAREQANTTESEMIKDMAKLENHLQIIKASVTSAVERVRKEMQSRLDNALEHIDRARIAAEIHGTAITQHTETLEVQGKVINQLSNTITSATDAVSGAQKGLTRLEERLAATKNEVGQIVSSEQRAVAKRLEEHDQKLVDLRTLTDALRRDHARLDEDLLARNAQKAEDGLKPVVFTNADDKAAASIADDAFDVFKARVEGQFIATEDAINHLRTGLQEDVDTCEQIMADAQEAQEADLERTKEQLASLAQKFDGLEQQAETCSTGIQRLEQNSNEKLAKTSAAYESINDTLKAIQDKYATLQANTTVLSENVAALEKRTVPQAQMPAPPATAASLAVQDTAQFRPVPTQSPRGTSSRSGSTSGNGQANGIHSPRNPASPFGSGFANGAPLPRDIDVLTNQIRGMAGTLSNLKQRMDNLTTEEVTRAMVDQFVSLYPGAKEFPAIVGALQNTDARLDARLNSSDSRADALQRNQTEMSRRLDELAEDQVRSS